MALAGSQSNRPRLPPVPQALPTTQAEWDRLVNVFQQWRSAFLPKWIAPTLQNGWAYYGSPFEPPGFYMDVSGRVYLRGLVAGGTVGGSAPIFTLPTPYMPSYTAVHAIVTYNNVFGEVRVLGPADTIPGGIVVVSGSNTWLSLSGISFSTTP